jgi:hypothetical protein
VNENLAKQIARHIDRSTFVKTARQDHDFRRANAIALHCAFTAQIL